MAVAFADRLNLLRIGRARVPARVERVYGPADYCALHLFYESGHVRIDSHSFLIEPGTITVTPAGAVSVYTTDRPLEHVFAHFRLEAEDGTNEGALLDPTTFAPDRGLEPAAATFRDALTVYAEDPRWAEVKICDLLLTLRHLARDESAPRYHSALAAAVAWIQQHLPEPCTLGRLAGVAGVSPTHLNRLFVAAFGTSAMRYLRARRLELAHYLLSATTLSVAEIGYQVGIPDVHAFNKLCKRAYGQPPTALRRSALDDA